ncbi:MAG: hypothetical protein ACLP5H_29740 [Desulfomonilaceae bacterium]
MNDEVHPQVAKCWSDIRHHLESLPEPDRVYCESYTQKKDVDPEGGFINTSDKSRLDVSDPMLKTLFWLAQRYPKTRFMPTESHELWQEFKTFCEAMKQKYGQHLPCEPTELWSADDSGMWRDIIKRRDIHVAGRIDETLRMGEVGVLFLGASHNEDNHLVALLESMRIDVDVFEVLASPGE